MADHVDTRKVFVVHGRDGKLRSDVFQFLRSIGLIPLEWSQAITLTGKPSPYIGEILDVAFGAAAAVVVLLTPDDDVKLRQSLWLDAEDIEEREVRSQARPNVLFEAGMAMGRYPERTVLVEVGRVKRFSDVAGRHSVRLDNKPESRKELAQRLENAGCAVDTRGTDWLHVGDLVPTAP